MTRPASIYVSPEWKALRLAALRRDGWKCVMCGAPLWGKGKARVDHIKPLSERPDLGLVLANTRSLCPACDNLRHRAEKGGQGKARNPYPGCDANGQPLDPGAWWNQGR